MSPAGLARSPLVRAIGVVMLANLVFLALMIAAQGDAEPIVRRVRTAFATGDLADQDFLPLDARRGYFQYNDCLVLQMLTNPGPSRVERALAPRVFHDEEWEDQCARLHGLIDGRTDPKTLSVMRYVNYWHGYNAVSAFALRSMELRTLRRMLVVAVAAAIGLLALAAWRAGPCVRRTAGAIALIAATVWAVPYYSAGLTEGPGDAIVVLGLAGLALRPRTALSMEALLPYAAGFGAVVGFLEMMTGQYLIAAAWLAALTLAARRDEERPGDGGARMAALAAVAVFCLGAAVTTAGKHVAAEWLTAPDAGGETFRGQARYYMGVPDSESRMPGILLPFLRLIQTSGSLTYGRTWAGYVLVLASIVAAAAASIRGWRERSSASGGDVLLLVGAALIPIAWVLALSRHTYQHAGFMVRILVVPISLAPLALLWSTKPGGDDQRAAPSSG